MSRLLVAAGLVAILFAVTASAASFTMPSRVMQTTSIPSVIEVPDLPEEQLVEQAPVERNDAGQINEEAELHDTSATDEAPSPPPDPDEQPTEEPTARPDGDDGDADQ